jgi:hypothetical protein
MVPVLAGVVENLVPYSVETNIVLEVSQAVTDILVLENLERVR